MRSITASFGNTLQVGVPLVAGVFGESGLAVHITVVSLPRWTLLTIATVLVEMDLARHTPYGASLKRDHPPRRCATPSSTRFVLPVLCGFARHATGIPLPAVLDEVLQVLGSAVAPLCLVLDRDALSYGLRPARAMRIAAPAWPRASLLVLPALVLGIRALGLRPVGHAARRHRQRWPRCRRAERIDVRATLSHPRRRGPGAIVLGTLLFAATAPIWLAIPAWLT